MYEILKKTIIIYYTIQFFSILKKSGRDNLVIYRNHAFFLCRCHATTAFFIAF